MKIVLYCDKFLYHKLYRSFPKYDEQDRIIGSLFSTDEFDNFHIQDRHYLNLALNPLDGIHDIYMLLIQKSWYRDANCINICKYVKQLHPETNVVFFMDEPVDIHSYFCHRIVNEKLGYIASDIDELSNLIRTDFSLDQGKYLLPKMKKGQLKKLQKQFQNS